MEEFKAWVKGHKALAIGGGIALVVLLYLWLRSGSSTGAGNSSNAALAAYYNAEAGSTQSAAAQVVAQDQLQAQENATNTQGQVYQSEIAAQKAPIQAQLDALTQLANLQAYQDYLGAVSGAQTPSTPPTSSVIGATTQVGNLPEDQGVFGVPGQTGVIFRFPWQSHGGPGAAGLNSATSLNALESLPGVQIIGTTQIPGTAPAPATPATPPVQPGQFNGFSAPTL